MEAESERVRQGHKSSTVQRRSSPVLIRTLKTDTLSESELIIVRGNGRRGPIYRRFIDGKSDATAYQLAKVPPPQSHVQEQ